MEFYLLDYYYRYAKSVGATHYHTSAKLNKGVEELFVDLTKRKSLLGRKIGHAKEYLMMH